MTSISKQVKPCACGYIGKNFGVAANHKKTCKDHIGKIDQIKEQAASIVEQYKEKQTIVDIEIDYDKDYLGDIKLLNSLVYGYVRELLKKEGVYDPRNKTVMKRRTDAIAATTMERYGVVNIGCLPNAPRTLSNKIPYDKISYLTDKLKAYQKEVDFLTKKNAKKMSKPEFCEYTGIRFADAEPGATSITVNPNDPRKRTVDHVIPVIFAYLNKIPAERAADPSNLKFCLRYVNTIKGNTLLESFLPLAAQLREVFINEGYSHRPFTAEI